MKNSLLALGLLLTVSCKLSDKPGAPQGDIKSTTLPNQSRGGNGNQNADGLPLQSLALSILEKECAACHSLDNPKGGFGTVLDVDEMIKSNTYLVPGEPERSEIIRRLAPEGNMPPSGVFAEEDRDILVRWVKELKPTEIVPFSDSDQLTMVRTDIEQKVANGDRRSTRYFSLQVANNAGVGDDVKKEMVKALAKILNSFSRSVNIVNPVQVDERGLVFRMNLRDLGINPDTFDSVISDFYPYSLSYVEFGDDATALRMANDHNFLQTETGTNNYLIRMDWFNATATLPILYARLLNLPDTQEALEAQLSVDRIGEITRNQVIRAGFRNSGVSSQNRVLERVVSSNNLAYWISYDFADNNEGQQNIFNFPLGPLGIGFDDKAFDFDGGEIIFQLPNGLFGYYLNIAAGDAIHKGPLNIVRQGDGPPQFFQAILNGISCMSCHQQGLLYKKDEIRSFAALSQDLSAVEKEKVFNLYRPDADLRAAMDRDNAVYFQALQKMNIEPTDRDPVNIVYLNFNKNLFRQDVKAELGVSDEQLQVILNAEPFKSAWVSIYNNSGSITREEFNLFFGLATSQFRSNVVWTPPAEGDHLASPACMVGDRFLMDICTSPLSEDGIDGANEQ